MLPKSILFLFCFWELTVFLNCIYLRSRPLIHDMPCHRLRSLCLASFISIHLSLLHGFGTSTTAFSTLKMVNSNPVLEMIVHGDPVRLILTADLDGILVCEDASTSRRDWLMTDSEFDNARKRLRYELHWVSPETKESDVQTPTLGYTGRVNVGFFRLDNQELQMAAVAYYLGSLEADGFIGAGFAFHPDQSPLSETIQQTTIDSHSNTGRDHSKKNVPVFIISNEIEVARTVEEREVDSYVWSEPFVPLGDSSDDVFNSQGISFPIHGASFTCNVPSESGSDTNPQSVQLFGDYSSSWDVMVDFNAPCLELPAEFYDALAGWTGLRLNSRLGLSETATPAAALPDLLFSLSFDGVQLALPLQSLVLPDLSESSPSNQENSTKFCIQRSASMLQRGTAAYAAPTTSTAEVARLQRLHGSTGIPVYNMIDSPVTFGAMVLDALGSVTVNGLTRRVGIRKALQMADFEKQTNASCLQSVSCNGDQQYVSQLNVCQDPDCSQFYFHRLDEETKHCVIDPSWTVMLMVTTTLFVTAELFLSLSLRRFVSQSQHE